MKFPFSMFVTTHSRSFFSDIVFDMALIQAWEIAAGTQMEGIHNAAISQPHLPFLNGIITKVLRDEPQPFSSMGFSGELPRGGRCWLDFCGLELFGGLCKMHCSRLGPQSIL